VDALNHTTTSGYDAANRRTSTTDAANHTTQFAYDARNRLVTTTYPDNTTSTHTYDGMGRELTMTDQAGKITTKAYDDAGQLTFVTDALSHATQYLYDASGNLIRINDANNHSTLFQYDSLNRRVLRWLPIGMAETKEYDAVGNVSTQTDFNGKTTTFTYDTLNRLLTKIPDASLSQPTISYTYTPAGKRATMVDATGTTTYTYDNRNRLTGKATPQGTLSYTYDAHGNVLTIASSNVNGGSMTYTYDSLNRLATVVDNRLLAQGMNPATTSYSYDAIGDLTTYTYPNGVQTIATFDALNRLTQIGSSKTGALSNFAYTLGPAGNRLSAVELGGRTVSYGYDNVYRLISEAIANSAPNNGTVNYTYDSVGNRMQMTSTLGAVPGGTFSYDANDRLALDTWDANGNTISSAGISYVYDFENRLTLRGAVSIVYDGDGNRVSETVGGVPTKYLVDELNPTGYSQVVDELVSGSVVRTYAYGLSRVSQNQFISGTWTPSFYGYDGHGSVRFLADASGVVTDTYQFDAFGNQIASTGTTPNNFLFSGEQLDSSTGLYQLRARWYRPTVGRFITRDPVEGGSCCAGSAGEFCASRRFNPYIYASNDPVNHADPTGQAVLVGTAIRDQYIILGTATGLTALYYALSMARNVNCYLWGEGMITDPFNRQVYLICYYICDDLEIEVEQGEFGVPCPDRIKKKSR
jgi:RHS repeat-associated protein